MTQLKEGDKAPVFSGINQDGEKVTLADYQGKKLVLFFYPKDNTPTCTVEVCNLRDNYELLQERGFELLGVSADSERKHQNFINKYNLPFPLLSDKDHTVLNQYGVYGPKKMFGRLLNGIYRTTFVIDEQGGIEKVITDVKAKSHTQQILEAVEV